MADENAKAEIRSIDDLLKMELRIPDYQRPYKWTRKNVSELLDDIDTAIEESKKYNDKFKYRIGTVILHRTTDENGNHVFDIVDGQQRIITLSLIKYALDNSFEGILNNHRFTDVDSPKNIYDNNALIRERLDNCDMDELRYAFMQILEVVVLKVKNVSEAFQLFDSQNTRGKGLDPHDLLKAYHLREMRDYPLEQLKLVKRWEAIKPKKIRELFSLYLYPILNWSRKEKLKAFTAQDIDTYKGVDSKCDYTYAQRIRRAMPCFQIDRPFSAGGDFFLMVEHYIGLLDDLKKVIITDNEFCSIKTILETCINGTKEEGELYTSIGSRHAETLFYCALLFYYDRFHRLDYIAVKKLFAWAMMIRVDMRHLGFDTINNYAIGNSDKESYTNRVQMFYLISTARSHSEICNLKIDVVRKPDEAKSKTWGNLYDLLKELMAVEK